MKKQIPAKGRKYADIWITTLAFLPKQVNEEFDELQDQKCEIVSLETTPMSNQILVTIIYKKTE